MTSEGTDDLWRSPGINFEAYSDETADVPTVYAGGWYDSYTKATCDNFVELVQRKASDHYLLMGPWTHGWDAYPQPSWNKPYSGELAFGSEATKDYQRTRLRFFDHYLKGKGTWADQPTVQYWCMGTGDGHRVDDHRLFHGGEWRSADDWPPADIQPTRYYAHANGSLSTEKPSAAHSSTSLKWGTGSSA
jgi:putative CocE/NonD family hydrolase